MGQGDPTSRGDDHGQLADLRAAVRRAPDDADAWARLAMALHRVGRPAAVLQVNVRALVLAPDSPALWSIHAWALMILRRHDEALAAYDRVTRLLPEDPVAWHQRATALFAGHRRASEHLEQALACFDRALALAPHYALCWRNKSLALTVLGRRDEARAAAERAKELGAWDDVRHAWKGQIDDPRFDLPWRV